MMRSATYRYTWNLNDLYFWRSTPQKQDLNSNQNKGHQRVPGMRTCSNGIVGEVNKKATLGETDADDLTFFFSPPFSAWNASIRALNKVPCLYGL